MIQRELEQFIRQKMQVYPAVALIGPRQCGKTTLAKMMGKTYYDMEIDADRLRLDLDWDALLGRSEMVIIDEAQHWPEIFQRIRSAIDGDRKRNGRFLLLGSVSPALINNIAETLAGRLALCELTPLCLSELHSFASVRNRWLFGGFPDGGILESKMFPDWQRNYLTLLTQRDLPLWGLPSKPMVTDRLMRMVAALHGQSWNASKIGQGLGLSYHTVNTYLKVLVGAFLIRILPSYQGNIRKRLVKSPKVYWRDSGLLHTLLGISDEISLLANPLVGASWEGFVIEEISFQLRQKSPGTQLYYFRSSDQHEIDLLMEINGELWAVESKLTSQPSVQDMQRLKNLADMVGCKRHFLISQVAKSNGDSIRGSFNLEDFIYMLRDL